MQLISWMSAALLLKTLLYQWVNQTLEVDIVLQELPSRLLMDLLTKKHRRSCPSFHCISVNVVYRSALFLYSQVDMRHPVNIA